jgi:DHA2 family methylenomycin A resistance protein-like MFS transporter
LVIAGIVLAVVGGLGFGLWQRRSPRKIYPGRLLRNHQFNAANLIGFLLNIGMYGTVFLISYLLQTVRGASVQEAGLQLLPMMLGFVVGNLGFARVATRMGTRAPLIVGMGIATLATLALALMFGRSTPIWVIAATVGVTNLGLGIVSPAMTSALMGAVTSADTGTAGAMLNLNRNIGSLIGVAIFAGILSTTTNWYASGALALGVAAIAYALACATAFTTNKTHKRTAAEAAV